MRLVDCDASAIAQRIAEVDDSFHTGDVCDAPTVLAAHGPLAAERAYRSVIGRYLRRHAADLHIRYEGAGSDARGARWSRTSTQVISEGDAISDTFDFGPQHPNDREFTARMRRHQSWWRANVIKAPAGTGPRPTSSSTYGNMLAHSEASAGRNFLTRGIAAVAEARVGAPNIEPFRLTHNLLSSQILCFNLLAPLVQDLSLATRVFGQLIPDLEEVRSVEIEHTPAPRAEFLGDGTSFDALLRYRTTHGLAAFLGIEVKLAENPSTRPEKLRRSYVDVTKSGPWTAGPELLREPPGGQLWRDHMLVEAARRHPSGVYGERGTFMLVRHPQDDVWAGVAATYAQHTPTGFVDVTLDRFVDALWDASDDPDTIEWLVALGVRYLDLGRSA